MSWSDRRTRREFIEESLLAAAATLPFASCAGPRPSPVRRKPAPPSEVIRVGVIGVRGRGRAHVGAFKESADSEVAAICDPDEGVIGRAMESVPDAKYYKDIRELLDDDSIDAVSIATPNHWHSLASIWALEAGKHVYVEKPISHNLLEGRRVIEAAERHGKIVQHGTQSRSQPATRDAIEWLRSGALGRVRLARGLCYKRRKSIGKVDGPQRPPETLDYGLWTGPAELRPLMRKNLHYDWHWDFNTGNGDIGNQGVHQLDIARWGLGRSELPRKVVSLGARLGYDDDGETPNTMLSLYDYGDARILFQVRGLKTEAYRDAKIGVVFHCEHGYLVSASYTKLVGFDLDGKPIRTFQGEGSHFQNFLDAVRSGSPDDLNSGCREGHLSTALCHLGNISYLLGRRERLSATDTPFGDEEAANEAFLHVRRHLWDNGIDLRQTDYTMGEALDFDPEAERFTGEGAARADPLLTRVYREPFTIPELD